MTPSKYEKDPRIIDAVENGPAERWPTDYLAAFANLTVADASDMVGPLYTMDSGIRPLTGSDPGFVGQALTVKAPPGDNLAVHHALDRVQPGDVLVIDWRGCLGACGAGSESLIEPIQRGLRGVVIDGAWRDIDQITQLGFPLFGRGVTAHSGPKASAGEINVPVSCGGVVVNPGDLVLADRDGVVVIPRGSVERALARLTALNAQGI